MTTGPTKNAVRQTYKLVERASRIDDLDKAVGWLQEVMGQPDGGVAGAHFSNRRNPEEDWRGMAQESRITALQLYLDDELAYAVDPDETPAPPGP